MQAWKFARIVAVWLDGPRASSQWLSALEPTTLFRALLLDFTLLYALYRLAIPQRDATPAGPAMAGSAPGAAPGAARPAPRARRAAWMPYVVVFVLLALLDAVLLGGERWSPLALASWALAAAARSVLVPLGMDVPRDPLASSWSLAGRRVRMQDIVRPQTHITGQHTVHILPYGTAQLAPAASCQCIGGTSPAQVVPVVFNRTRPAVLHYSVTDVVHGNRSTFSVHAPALEPYVRKGAMAGARPQADEPDVPHAARGMTFRDRVRERANRRRKAALRDGGDAAAAHATELVHYLRVTHTGIVHLESVLDASRNAARVLPGDMLVVPCPSASFEHHAAHPVFCPGDEGNVTVHVRGVPPLTLEYAQGGAVQALSHIAPPEPHGAGAAHLPAQRLDAARAAGAPLHAEHVAWARPAHVALPLALDLSRPGVQHFDLRSVRDVCGNAVDLHAAAGSSGAGRTRGLLGTRAAAPAAPVLEHTVSVHPRAQAHFSAAQCTADAPLKLLRGSGGHELRLAVEEGADGAQLRAEYEVEVQYTPDAHAALPRRLTAADAWTRTLKVRAGATDASVYATAPGTYTIARVDGPRCSGSTGAPWTCEVVDVPPPTADIHFESIEDPCAGTVGVKALSVLEGEPPFRLLYEVQRAGQRPQRQVRVVREKTRDELEFWPSTEGPVTYRFYALEDAHYTDIPLDGPSFTAVVHPLASAAFAPHHGDAASVASCGSTQAHADVAFSGTGPWDLTYAVRTDGGTPVEHHVRGIRSPTYGLDVALPPEALAARGAATISLVRVRDGKGCTRRLATRDLRVDVSRSRASVGFLPSDAGERRSLTVTEGRAASLPLRLTGDAPWTVRYRMEPEAGGAPVERTARLSTPNAALEVREPGTYTILSLHDAHCPGEVLSAQATYRLALRPRPEAHFALDAGERAANGSLLRPPVCEGTVDSAELELRGFSPVQVAYDHVPPVGVASTHRFSTSQRRSPVQLVTTPSGWHTYEIGAVGDAMYAPAAPKAAARLEQQVWPQARASFAAAPGARRERPTFCLGDSLGSGTATPGAAEPRIALQGTPPFMLELELRPVATARTAGRPAGYRFTRTGIASTSYVPRLAPGEFAFGASGAWELVILQVGDAHACGTYASSDAAPLATLPIEVVETAGIVPATTRTDYCVGERIDYILQGTSPWTVHYTFNQRDVHVTSRRAEFSRTAERPGVLTVHSAAHQQNQCRSGRNATVSVIHELPSVQVYGGRHYVESLHEGNQAEIVFHLRGEPPFAFTYQRTEPADTHHVPRVLETHTVSGVQERKYSIRTTQEGTWSVVWLQDRWCQVSLGQASGPAAWPEGAEPSGK